MLVDIYLKSKKKPIKFDLSKKEYSTLVHLLRTNDIIEFGALVFHRDNFSHAIIN